jgi:hypothetical protein
MQGMASWSDDVRFIIRYEWDGILKTETKQKQNGGHCFMGKIDHKIEASDQKKQDFLLLLCCILKRHPTGTQNKMKRKQKGLHYHSIDFVRLIIYFLLSIPGMYSYVVKYHNV